MNINTFVYFQIPVRLAVFDNIRKPLHFGCPKGINSGIFSKLSQSNNFGVTPKRFIVKMSGNDTRIVEDEEKTDQLQKTELQKTELQKTDQPDLNVGEHLEQFETTLIPTGSFETFVKENTNNILESEKTCTDCSVNDLKVKAELVESANIINNSVGTQCSGSSEDCIMVFKSAWSEGEDEEENELKTEGTEVHNTEVTFKYFMDCKQNSIINSGLRGFVWFSNGFFIFEFVVLFCI